MLGYTVTKRPQFDCGKELKWSINRHTVGKKSIILKSWLK